MRAQTHSDQTHERYYAKAAQRQDGQNTMDMFQKNVVGPIRQCMTLAEHDVSIVKTAIAASASNSEVRNYVRRTTAEPNVVASTASTTDTIDDDEYGSMHPHFLNKSAKGKKIPWSEEEIQWIQGYFEEHPEILSSLEKNATVLHAIRLSTADEKAIFHLHHVYDSGRIRSGVTRAIGVVVTGRKP
jgi:dUTPase